MKIKRITAIIVISIVCSLSCVLAFSYSSYPFTSFTTLPSFFAQTDQMIKTLMPFADKIREGGAYLKYISGQRISNEIYIADDFLMQNIQVKNAHITDENNSDIIDFATQYRVPTYVMLLPTSCAINQHMLDSYASSILFNQKQYIENVHRSFESSVSTVNVYPTLFTNRELPLYYKTQSNLTSQGAYFVYQTLATRLKLAPNSLERYNIEYMDTDFYGDLYEQSEYKDISADKISLYIYNRYHREYSVKRTDINGTQYYYTLFPTELANTGDPMDIFLGGVAMKIDIDIFSPYNTKLLIFADTSALTYIPYLASHYSQITYVNPFNATEAVLSELDIKSYDQVLFSFSVDNYANEFLFNN